MSATHARLRQLGLGKLALHLYHTPVARVRACFRAGGPWQQRRTAAGRREMKMAARKLAPLLETAHGGTPVVVHVLTGDQFWDQTAFCLWSLGHETRRPLAPVFYDDGTLAGESRDQLARLFPHAKFVHTAEITARLNQRLPQSRFPYLRDRWQHYPNIRKLTDPHVGATGWKLVIDSDLLFFRRPDLLLKWHDAPANPLHAVDSETSYGYSRALLEELAGAPLTEKLNVGLCGLASDQLDWDRIEFICRTLIQTERTHYYLEQALVAVLLAGRSCTIAPAVEYVTLPRPPEALECRAVMHHYVADSKRWYFQRNWRRFATESRAK